VQNGVRSDLKLTIHDITKREELKLNLLIAKRANKRHNSVRRPSTNEQKEYQESGLGDAYFDRLAVFVFVALQRRYIHLFGLILQHLFVGLYLQIILQMLNVKLASIKPHL
jgi:hypothetical protein